MKRLSIVLSLSLVSLALAACTPNDAASAANSAPAVNPATQAVQFATTTGAGPVQSNAKPAALSGRWEILPTKLTETFPIPEEGWKLERVNFALENRTSAYSSPFIPTKGAQLFTDPTHSYDVQTLRSTGTIITQVSQIVFQAKLPPGVKIRGEVTNDTVGSYYFESKIPLTMTSKFLRLPGYDGNIAVDQIQGWENGKAFEKVEKLKSPGTQIDISGRAAVTIGNFGRKTAWPPVYDMITATLTLTNKIETSNAGINLQYLALGDDGIIGAAYYAAPDCKPELNLGPSVVKTSSVCAIVPRQAANVRMIFTGDITEIYETGK